MHHAYVYEGFLSELQSLAHDARKRFGFAEEHNPDVHVREFEKFGIDESRALADLASLRGATGKSLFILGISSITSEAQQALLKLFEEPQQGTTFVVLLPHGVLLPTLRSRVLPYPSDFQQGSTLISRLNLDVQKFLKASGKDRSDMVAKLLKDEDGVKDRVREFVQALEAALLPKIKEKAVQEALSDIAKTRDYLRDRSPSLKMLLEHLALSVPRA